MKRTSTVGFLLGTASLGLLLKISTQMIPSTGRSHPVNDTHLQVALDLGLHLGDPTLDRLMARDLRFAGLTGSDQQLASEGRRLGLTTRSSSARKRLYKRLEDIILAGIPEPDAQTLARHFEQHPELLPAREEVRLRGPDGPTGWLGPADRARRHTTAEVIDRRRVDASLDDPSQQAVIRAHWRSAELRRRWSALGSP